MCASINLGRAKQLTRRQGLPAGMAETYRFSDISKDFDLFRSYGPKLHSSTCTQENCGASLTIKRFVSGTSAIAGEGNRQKTKCIREILVARSWLCSKVGLCTVQDQLVVALDKSFNNTLPNYGHIIGPIWLCVIDPKYVTNGWVANTARDVG